MIRNLISFIKYYVLTKIVQNKVRRKNKLISLEHAKQTTHELQESLQEIQEKTDEQVNTIRNKVSEAEIKDMLARSLSRTR